MLYGGVLRVLHYNIDSKSRLELLNADEATLLYESITAHRGALKSLNSTVACFVRKGAAS